MRAIAVAILLTAVPLLAGCLQDAPVGAAETETPDAPALVQGLLVHKAGVEGLLPLPEGIPALEGILLPVGADAFEPTLGVTSDGAIFFAATGDNVAIGWRPLVMRSIDGGLTWEDKTPTLAAGLAVPPETNDPYLYVDPMTDRVFQFAMAPILICSMLSWSDDLGESWTSNPHGCFTTPPWDHQTMVASKPKMLTPVGYDNVLHQCVNSVYAAVCSRSLDGGWSWSPGIAPFAGVKAPEGAPNPSEPGSIPFCGGLHGHVVSTPDGTVLLPKEHCGAPMLAISDDDGTSWRAVRVSPLAVGGGADPAVASDAAGNIYYVFLDSVGRIQLVVSQDGGATWSEAVVASPPGVAAALPAIAAGADGRIALAYPGTPDLPNGSYEEATDEDHANSRWHGYLTLSLDAASGSPTFMTTRVNPEAEPLVRGPCGTIRCPGFVDFMDIVIGPDGKPYASFVDACSAKCEAADEPRNDQGLAVMGTLKAGPLLIDAVAAVAEV